jgi:hypothetical protein
MMSNPMFEMVTLEEAGKFYALRFLKKSLLALLILLLLSFSALAQSADAIQTIEPKIMLTGVVYDINGAVIVDTLVVAYNKDGKKYETATNDEGVYKIELPLALYVIQAGADGFCPGQVDRFRVVNSTHGKMSLDFVLDVAESPQQCKHQLILETRPKRTPKKKKPNLLVE